MAGRATLTGPGGSMKYQLGYLNCNTETDPFPVRTGRNPCSQLRCASSCQARSDCTGPTKGAMSVQTYACVTPRFINAAWNCGAKCAELSCPSPVYVARGERKQEEHECPLSWTGLPDFLEFLKLLACWDGSFF